MMGLIEFFLISVLGCIALYSLLYLWTVVGPLGVGLAIVIPAFVIFRIWREP
jgi:hypothetical protein